MENENNDHLMTEEKTPRKKSAVFGAIALLSSLILILTATLFPLSGSEDVELDAQSTFKVTLILHSRYFAEAGVMNPCDGVAPLKGIKGSKYLIKSPSWNSYAIIPSGNLDTEGNCRYEVFFTYPESFKGGKITVSAEFPFGKPQPKELTLEDAPPYAAQTVDIYFS